jgi:hypothetical protein
MELTAHARRRAQERRITEAHVQLALDYGHEVHAAGATFYVLRFRDLPRALRGEAWARRAEGTTVVVADETVLTVYRNRDVGHVRRKLAAMRPRGSRWRAA